MVESLFGGNSEHPPHLKPLQIVLKGDVWINLFTRDCCGHKGERKTNGRNGRVELVLKVKFLRVRKKKEGFEESVELYNTKR